MLNLLKKANVIPKSLFIADIKIDIEQGMINIGGFGRVFLGKYKGELVALKLLGKGLKDFSQELVLEVLARRSLSHPFVLPLLGIFIDRSLPYFVSPHMKISLTEWRKTHTPTVPEINRLVQEVAAGVRYFHEEGIVHGDLRGENVLLDAEHHCRIAADVGLSQQDNAIVTLSAEAVLFNFAAPELFVNLENREARVGSKTTQTDVYAFGCLYYSIFFNTVPFEGENEYQIMQLVSAGKRPDRLQNPKIAEGPWNLILKCWKAHPSERPSMERIVMILLKFTPLLSLLAILKEVYIPRVLMYRY
ncbi:kinase-like domain-containing protein [Amanita rubescens]|nr:kinase-like domain-containing protein [Amanita rubescens]